MSEAALAPKLEPCAHQAGGHFATAGKDAATFTDGHGRFYKACQDMVRGGREAALYELIFSDDLSVEQEEGVRTDDLKALRQFVPQYYGLVEADGKKLLALDDSCYGYKHPCVLDAKIGLSTAYDWADEKYIKKCREKDAETTQCTLGFRVTGFRVYQQSKEDYFFGDRMYGKRLTAETMPEAFKIFGSNGRLTPKDIYGGPNGAIAQLKRLEAWFKEQRSLVFYASSTIIIYEGDAQTPEEAKVKVCLIDFAHTYPSKGKADENFMPGLATLISIFEKLAA